MSSLRNLLNPKDEVTGTTNRLVDTERPSLSSEAPSPPASSPSGNTTIEGIRVDMAPKDHEPHPDCPDTLACLPDTEGRPQHTLPVILRCAILGSPRRRLTIREIYAAMEQKYPYYKTAGPTWKQSVRHHLSLNLLFERQPRPVTDPGFGSYWTVNLKAPPGTKRPRKRGRPNRDADEGPIPVKRRGRPRKNQPGLTTESSNQISLHGGDDDDEALAFEEDADAGRVSEEEYESEEEMVHPFERGEVVSRMSAYTVRSSSQQYHRNAFGECPDNVIDRLQIEMEGLRRQSADAVSVSLRMSDQLAQAQAEASRTKASLRTAENMLEDESRKRREAEKAADDEAKMRRIAEESLKALQLQLVSSPPT